MFAIYMCDDLLGIYLIAESAGPWTFAEQMGRGHLFDVKVLAMVHGDLGRILSALQDCHISGQWYQCSLQHIIGVWGMFSEEHTEVGAASGSSEASESIQPSEWLPICLTHCAAAQAPLAVRLREDIIQFLGKLEGNSLLQNMTASTGRINGNQHDVLPRDAGCSKGLDV